MSVSGNFIFGSKLLYGTHGAAIHDVDSDQSGFAAICEALKECHNLNSIDFSDIGMGPKGAVLTSAMLRSPLRLVD